MIKVGPGRREEHVCGRVVGEQYKDEGNGLVRRASMERGVGPGE